MAGVVERLSTARRGEVRRQVNASNFSPEKHKAARRWLYWAENRLVIIGLVVAAIAAAATVAGLWRS